MSKTNQRTNKSCFHCGQRCDDGQKFPTLKVFNKTRNFCCMGCYGVCQMIVESGLDEYYRYRLLEKSRPAEVPDFLTKYQIYDQENIQKSFVVQQGKYKEAYLLLENIRCPACVWLNEKHLRQQPGVLEVHIDVSSNRARVKWQPEQTSLSKILAAIANIGYLAHPYNAEHSRKLGKLQQRRNVEKLLFAVVIGMMLMQFSIATYLLDTEQNGELHNWVKLGRWSALVGALSLLIYPAQDFFIGAWQDLRRRRIGMDVPVVFGLLAAFFGSLNSTINNQGEVYFDSIAMFIIFILLARFLEFRARKKSISKLDQLNIAIAQSCEKWIKKTKTWEKIAVADLKMQDLIKVKPGEIVMADGKIVAGSSSFDESLLTGEQHLIAKTVGDKVIAGAVNYEQTIQLLVEQTGGQTVLSQIGQIATRALEDKPKIAMQIDKVASWFVAGVLLVALATATYWLLQDDDLWLAHTIAVLIVTCPCALALATPVALTLGMERFIDQGILPLKTSSLGALAHINQLAFDKTGTLTNGKMQVLSVEMLGDIDKQKAIKLACSLANSSEHIVAKSLLSSFSLPDLYTLSDFENTPGFGIKATIGSETWQLKRLDKGQIGQFDLPKYQNKTLSILTNNSGAQALFVFADELRDGAQKTVSQIRKLGIQNISLLSGDNASSVAKVAQQAGIKKYLAHCSPQDKLSWLREQQSGKGKVLFVGDGINDAPILAGADASISLYEASDMANIHSDFIVLNNRLGSIIKAIKSSRFVNKIIRQNLFWAIFYNITAIPLAALGLVAPWLAALGMSLSSLLVVLNALRL